MAWEIIGKLLTTADLGTDTLRGKIKGIVQCSYALNDSDILDTNKMILKKFGCKGTIIDT